MSLPEWYKKWIERVSNVVSFAFPFEWTEWERRYLSWLKSKGIEVGDYMEEACSVWTFIHLQMEKEIHWEEQDLADNLYTVHNKEIVWGLKYIADMKALYPNVRWDTEVVVCDEQERYQWSLDLIRVNEKTKTVWIYDWKTWGIAKKKWWLPNSPKKNSDKLKKVALQLSLYAETYRQKGYTIWWIYVVHLHEEWAFEWSLNAKHHRQKEIKIKIWTTEELNVLLEGFFQEPPPEDFYLIKHPWNMIVELRKPTEQYWYLNVTIDMYQEKDGVTLEEKIDEAKKIISYTMS